MSSKGLAYKKFDLHIHTPASQDYKDKNVTPNQIVNEAIEKNLSAIAITDHQSAKFVDSIKNSAIGKDLVVFPAVEVTGTGGESGVHVILIFDVDKTSEYVTQFLNKINIDIKTEDGIPIAATKYSVGEISDILFEYDSNAILILAHSHSSKGVTGDIKGITRDLIFNKNRTNILGAEANESDFKNENKKQDHKRVFDIFDGTDQAYGNRKIGVYQSSDAHSLYEIGSSYTYFKVDSKITIEDLRQCLSDRDTRIKQMFEYEDKSKTYPRILNMKVVGGFLNDQTIEFHEGLNSILGAKGSGKSLVVEFLRFVFNLSSSNANAMSDYESKLEKCLKTYGVIECSYMDSSGKEYLIKRTYNPALNNPIEIIETEGGQPVSFNLNELFPVLFLSQNEIVDITQDKSGDGQRKFIDQFFNFHRYQKNIELLYEELKNIDHDFAEALRSHLKTQDITQRIATYKAEIDRLGRQITNPIFSKYATEETLGQAISAQLLSIQSITDMIAQYVDEFSNLSVPISDSPLINKSPSFIRSIEFTKKLIESISLNLNSIQNSEISETKKKLEEEYNSWQKSFEPIKNEYENLVKESGANEINMEQKRKQLISALTALEAELSKYRIKAQQIKGISEKRTKVLNNINHAYRLYFEKRDDRCKYFTEQCKDSLRVSIKEKQDTSSFKKNLMKIKKGSWLKDEEIDIISSSISPPNFVNNILRYEWNSRNNKTSLKEISETCKIEMDKVERLTNFILEEYSYEDILGLLYNSAPKDIPLIEYKIGNVYKSLEELSVGQKATTLLLIALSDGSFPIVIDQPEDSLDLRTIWNDVCRKLRDSKDQRQFIFTTHNSSVAVASDTDMFTILVSDSNQGKVLYSGTLSNPQIKQEVIDYLEGGIETYARKRKKYNL